jgi:hypothetical protein
MKLRNNVNATNDAYNPGALSNYYSGNQPPAADFAGFKHESKFEQFSGGAPFSGQNGGLVQNSHMTAEGVGFGEKDDVSKLDARIGGF